jgi:hypothetical protein
MWLEVRSSEAGFNELYKHCVIPGLTVVMYLKDAATKGMHLPCVDLDVLRADEEHIDVVLSDCGPVDGFRHYYHYMMKGDLRPIPPRFALEGEFTPAELACMYGNGPIACLWANRLCVALACLKRNYVRYISERWASSLQLAAGGVDAYGRSILSVAAKALLWNKACTGRAETGKQLESAGLSWLSAVVPEHVSVTVDVECHALVEELGRARRIPSRLLVNYYRSYFSGLVPGWVWRYGYEERSKWVWSELRSAEEGIASVCYNKEIVCVSRCYEKLDKLEKLEKTMSAAVPSSELRGVSRTSGEYKTVGGKGLVSPALVSCSVVPHSGVEAVVDKNNLTCSNRRRNLPSSSYKQLTDQDRLQN